MPEAPIVDRSGNIVENPAMKDFFENHLPNGQRFRDNPISASPTYDSVMARYKGTPSIEVSAKGRVYSPIVRDLLQRRKAGEIIPKSVMDRAITEHFPSYKVKVPKSPSDLPSQAEVLASITPDKMKKHLETMDKGLPLEGEKVTVRQDVPAMTDFGVGVVTTTTKNGKIYRPSTRIKDPVFVLNEIQTEKIGMGEAKAPHIVVNGKWSADQNFPKDLENWTQVGFNPDRHSYYYERGTNKMVVSGEEALQIGNTVFVKTPEFGDPMDANAPKRYMPEQARQMPEVRQSQDINDIRKQWDDLGIQHGLSERKNEIEPGIIKVPKSERNKGIGNNAMSILTNYADQVGKRIVVSPTNEFGSNKQRLINWYKKLGFVENKGRNKDFSTMKTMYRDPISQVNQSNNSRYMPESTRTQESALKADNVKTDIKKSNISGYQPRSQDNSEKQIKKSKSTTKVKTSAKSISDVANMK
jgi:hypothetical protein